jgi:ABC-type phosphate transport system substrate-binding protein
MEMKRSKSAIGLVLVALLLVACTPPMPPEFKADLAERYVTCVPGDISISSVPELAGIAQEWAVGISENCSNLSATVIDPIDGTQTAVDVFFSSSVQTPECTAVASSPVGIDAVAVAVNVEGLDGVIFSPALLHRALSGGMTSWADPDLQELNPALELTDTPVVLRAPTRPQDITSLSDWMGRLDPAGWPGAPSGLVADASFDAEALITELEIDGTISVVPASLVSNNSLQTISIQTAPDREPVYLNTDTVISAGTQMTASTQGSVVSALLDPNLAPIPAAGSNEALEPWQALNQFTITVCAGANEMAGRAFAKYALRRDSQGVMIVSGFTELPEQIRVAGVEAVSQGLPEPSIPPTDAPEEVPTDEPTEMPLENETEIISPEPTP